MSKSNLSMGIDENRCPTPTMAHGSLRLLNPSIAITYINQRYTPSDIIRHTIVDEVLNLRYPLSSNTAHLSRS